MAGPGVRRGWWAVGRGAQVRPTDDLAALLARTGGANAPAQLGGLLGSAHRHSQQDEVAALRVVDLRKGGVERLFALAGPERGVLHRCLDLGEATVFAPGRIGEARAVGDRLGGGGAPGQEQGQGEKGAHHLGRNALQGRRNGRRGDHSICSPARMRLKFIRPSVASPLSTQCS